MCLQETDYFLVSTQNGQFIKGKITLRNKTVKLFYAKSTIKLRPWIGKIYFQHIKQQICWFAIYIVGESLQISMKKTTDYKNEQQSIS